MTIPCSPMFETRIAGTYTSSSLFQISRSAPRLYMPIALCVMLLVYCFIQFPRKDTTFFSIFQINSNFIRKMVHFAHKVVQECRNVGFQNEGISACTPRVQQTLEDAIFSISFRYLLEKCVSTFLGKMGQNGDFDFLHSYIPS